MKRDLLLRDLATLLELGVSLPEALERLAPGSSELQKVRSGAPPAEALGVLASENLPGALRLTARLVRERERRLGAIARALAYPQLVLVMMIAVFLCVVYIVMPPFDQMYREMAMALPITTRWLFALSRSPLLLIAGLAAIAVIRAFFSSPQLDGLRLRVPWLGSFLRGQQTMMWLRGLEVLIYDGVPLPEALKVAANGVTSPVFRLAMEEVAALVERGETLGSALRKQRVFPGLYAWMLEHAERRELAAETLEEVGRALEVELERSFDRGVPLVEVLAILFLGFLMGLILSSVFLPLIHLMGNL